MKATITNISSKGKHVKVMIEKKVGFVTSKPHGWMEKAKDCKIGDTFEVPDNATITTEKRGDYVEMVIT